MLHIFMNTIFIIFCLLIAAAALAVYHNIKLKAEKSELKHIGQSVDIDGFNMNVYTEGFSKHLNRPIVLLSGSGVASPIYEYKILYSKLVDAYQVVVLEKFGYGYADLSHLPRDIMTMVEEDRLALKKAGIDAPYVLMPHSMSALEALYWANTYPEEVDKIIGLDMAVPNSYRKSNLFVITIKRILTLLGAHRIQAFYQVNKCGLSDAEYRQHKLLVYRNTLNCDVYQECKSVMQNAHKVRELKVPEVPILMFTTNLAHKSGCQSWVEAQEEFARQSNNCIQIKLDCGHDLHVYQADLIAHDIKNFLK